MSVPFVSSVMPWVADLLPLIALLLLCQAAYTDIRYRKISNWISVGLAACFFLYALFDIRHVEFGRHMAWGGITLALLLIPFAMGKMGGGDVKLLSAIILWGGPVHGFEMLILTALIGGALALITVSPSVKHVWDWFSVRFDIPEGLIIYPTAQSLPYGIAISAAGGFGISRMFIS